jgi:pimeloyl-ACP methyl ester carboxylesterase
LGVQADSRAKTSAVPIAKRMGGRISTSILWCDPKCFRSMAAHLECLPASAAALAANERLPDVPLVILSAANATPGEIEERDALAKTVSAGRHSVAAKSAHWIQLDEPELVIEAVSEVVERVRVDAAARRA